MAITKVLSMKENKGISKSRHLNNAIKYILNQQKTTGGLYVNSNCGCDAKEIFTSMLNTKQEFGKTNGRQGYHFVLSFLPGEATEETAYRIAEKFVSEYLQDNYDYVYAVHNDKDHIHAHIIFNSVSYDGYKYHYANGEWEANIQPVTDRLCADANLSTILLQEGGKGKSYGEWLAEKDGKMTWRDAVRMDLDAAIRVCKTYPELLSHMRKNGYEIREGLSKKHGKYLSIKPPYSKSKKAIRSYTLGKGYEVPELEKRVRIETSMKGRYVPAPRLKTYRQPGRRRRYQIASIYQLDYFRYYYRVKHFYNNSGAKYRKEIFQIDKLYQQCSYLFKNNIRGRQALMERKAEMQYQEKDLYRYRKALRLEREISSAPEEPAQQLQRIEEELQQLRREKRVINNILKGDESRMPLVTIPEAVQQHPRR